jgi:hypothetical protein
MRRLAALVAVAAVVAAAALALPGRRDGDASAARAASMRLVDFTPVTVRGRGFGARERVKVVVSFGAGRTRWVGRARASRSGRFTATVPAARLSRCSGFVIRAIGDAGSRAAIRRPQRPACYPLVAPASAA